jgi:superfamily II DNA or RNA helicase
MWIEVGNRLSKLLRATDEESDWIREYLSFPDVDARFKPNSDGKIHMFNVLGETFPTGFLPGIRRAAKDAKMEMEVVDRRAAPCAIDPAADLAWLRDYQMAAVDRALARKRGILWMTTGAGKTEIAVGLARALPCEWLFLVHRTSLGDQAAERFRMRNAEHGVYLGEPGLIGEGQWAEGERFTCATFQTIAKALANGERRAVDLLARVGGLVVDECHVLPASSFYDVTSACNAYYRIGLSGTPLDRTDRKSIYAIAALGPVIHRVDAETLVKAGVLAKARVRLVTCEQTARAATWQGVYNECIVRSKVRNQLILKIAKRAAQPMLVFVKQVEHGQKLANMLTCNGIRADFVWGTHSTDFRKSRVASLVAGRLDALVCSVIFQEGIDVPQLRAVINASGSKSTIATLQRLGRGMRMDRAPDGSVREGGDVFEMWDVMDVGNDWLSDHSKKRRNAYVAEGHETTVEPTLP